MNGYKFDDYGIFSSAIGTTNTVKTTFNTAGTDINSVNQTISDDGIFMGPIADECRNAISLLNTDLTMINENFSMIQNFLAETSQNYQTTDKNASTTVAGSKDGVLDLGFGTSGSGNSNVGTPDFSNNAAWISKIHIVVDILDNVLGLLGVNFMKLMDTVLVLQEMVLNVQDNL